MLTTTGYFPDAGFTFGAYSQPEISLPSKLFHFTSFGSTKFCAGTPPVSLKVQRSSLSACTSTEYTSEGDWAELKLRARSRLFSLQCSALIWPVGSFGTERSLLVLRSSTCSLLSPFSLTT